ncbi:MAG: DUF2062 domain-containing protein [Magnetococcus sp. DMHC-1]|nr:DUF2062 domain-containing protein [Magnetococcales bacterium]
MLLTRRPKQAGRSNRQRRSDFLWRWVVVQTKRHLIRYMLRSRHPPGYSARAAFVGLFVNFTPTVGFQVPLVVGIWSLARILGQRWHFNLPLACAWTLLTNLATMGPLYYLFLRTGRLMLGQTEATHGFASFVAQLNTTSPTDLGWLDSMLFYWHLVVDTFGLPLLIGSLPWALLTAILGYVWTMRFMSYRQKQRHLKNR